MISDPHPSRRDLEEFVLGRLDPRANLRLFLHLLPGCATCRAVTAELWWRAEGRGAAGEGALAGIGSEGSEGIESAVDRVLARVRRVHADLAVERAAAPGLLAELAALPAAERAGALRGDRRFHTWGVGERLVRESRHSSPLERTDLAQLAVEAVAVLPDDLYPRELVADLAARAWGAAADACRAASDLAGAEAALGAAEARLARGSGERLERAGLLEVKAGVRVAQGRCDEASRLLRRAAAIYRRTGQLDLLGRVLLAEGYARACAGDSAAALAALREGLALAAAEREPRLALAAAHSLIFLLHALGRPGEAAALLAYARPLAREHGDRMDDLRLRHLEARIAGADPATAAGTEETLVAVRAAFLAGGMGYDAALASLDLAEVYAGQGRHADLGALGESMAAVVRSRDLDREAAAALLLFQRAARARSATLALVREVAARVRRARRDG